MLLGPFTTPWKVFALWPISIWVCLKREPTRLVASLCFPLRTGTLKNGRPVLQGTPLGPSWGGYPFMRPG